MFTIVLLLLILIDLYAFQAIKTVIKKWSYRQQAFLKIGYWVISGLFTLGIIIYRVGGADALEFLTSNFFRSGILINYLGKIVIILFLLFDDLLRIFNFIYNRLNRIFNPAPKKASESSKKTMARSEFIAKAGIITATFPIAALSWGAVSGAYDYRVRRRSVYLKNLPRAFEGIKIGQISDIHSGSFWNKTAVQGGVEMLAKEKPDLIFFTGDLVNYTAEEMNDYISIFSKIRAPLGVYSTLGNHDYGDYVRWQSVEKKKKNFERILKTHEVLGWDLLMNENRKIKIDGDELGIIGIENWSAKSRFPKYGKLHEAYRGMRDVPTKLLLSHDPSHWKAQVVKEYTDIDLMFAGHTHGMQFGIEIGNLRWSPAKFMYDEWADLYRAENQYLYVNRGFGFIGYPGRIGIRPELTILELQKEA